MSYREPSDSSESSSDGGLGNAGLPGAISAGGADVADGSHAAERAADALIERRHPSDIDRLREVVGTDVLPFYRDEQAIVASQQASERWPHLVAVADSRGAPASPLPRSVRSN